MAVKFGQFKNSTKNVGCRKTVEKLEKTELEIKYSGKGQG